MGIRIIIALTSIILGVFLDTACRLHRSRAILARKEEKQWEKEKANTRKS